METTQMTTDELIDWLAESKRMAENNGADVTERITAIEDELTARGY